MVDALFRKHHFDGISREGEIFRQNFIPPVFIIRATWLTRIVQTVASLCPFLPLPFYGYRTINSVLVRVGGSFIATALILLFGDIV